MFPRYRPIRRRECGRSQLGPTGGSPSCKQRKPTVPHRAPKIPRHKRSPSNSLLPIPQIQSYPPRTRPLTMSLSLPGPSQQGLFKAGYQRYVQSCSQRNIHPTAPEKHLPPPYLPAAPLKANKAPHHIHANNSPLAILVTTPKMEPSFVTSRLARLSREPCRPLWVRMAATRSSSTTCRR